MSRNRFNIKRKSLFWVWLASNNSLFKIDYGFDQQSIWVSTVNSDIKNWSLKGLTTTTTTSDNLKVKKSKILNSENDEEEDDDDDFITLKALNENPQRIIKGGSSIKQYHVLNDKRFIIAKDTNENVFIFDVLKVSFSLLIKYFIPSLF